MGGADSIAEMSAHSSVYESVSINHTNWSTADEYVAPANGYLVFTQKTTSSGGNVFIGAPNYIVANCSRMPSERVSVYTAVKKGNIYTMRNTYGTVESCMFIYSIGSAKELGLI